jgi:hypothetical protein
MVEYDTTNIFIALLQIVNLLQLGLRHVYLSDLG